MATQYITQDVNGLTDEEMKRFCPSVFALGKHESRSERYTYIPTSDLLVALRQEGFAPTTAMQSRSRIEGKQDFTKHLLRLRKRDDLGLMKPDVHEVVLVNSHDGTSSYNLYSGIFRTVCTNGLITGDIDSTMKVYHKGDIVGQVVESTLRIVEESEEVMEEVAEMKGIPLSRQEQLLLAEFAMKARFDDPGEGQEEQSTSLVPYQPSDFLRVRRMADVKDDLYTTMNTLQENMIKGGISRHDRQGKKHTTRQIKGIDQNVKINRLLWQFSERLLEFKQS